jgi:hypothetical protein
MVAVSYHEQDGLGSVTSLTNSSGALADTYTFASFGNLTASTGMVLDPLRKPQSSTLRQPVPAPAATSGDHAQRRLRQLISGRHARRSGTTTLPMPRLI